MSAMKDYLSTPLYFLMMMALLEVEGLFDRIIYLKNSAITTRSGNNGMIALHEVYHRSRRYRSGCGHAEFYITE
ncbi:MAG: hypothetical protein RBG13Loki_2480 [Promethearchaeota archaeon CR_4]|nr:MAG: hypothetical protein RBG13Loki_2480 [Candidatus Lokiarchaeota archaeon CR_4]